MTAQPKVILEQILQHLRFDATVEEHLLEEGPLLEVKTDDPGRLIGRKGQTLVALQYITNRIIFQHDQTAPKVLIDVANYRSQAREELINKAKQAADTFIVRVGDVLSAGLVYVGTTVLGFHSAGFATVNVIACVLWLGVGVMLLKQYRRLAAQHALMST